MKKKKQRSKKKPTHTASLFKPTKPKRQNNKGVVEEELRLGRKFMAEYRETFAALAKS
jgi:hypothetical protein